MRDTIDMAREAGIKHDLDGVWCEVFELKAFEALVRADEREVCANAAMVAAEEAINLAMALEREACAKEAESWDCHLAAAEIRARGNT